jgi:hypothetical protein
MSGGGNRQMIDAFSLKTRNLVLQNQDGSFPTVGSVLTAGASGRIIPNSLSSIGVSSIEGGTGIEVSGSTGDVTVSVGPIYDSSANAFVVGATSSGAPAFRVDTSTGAGTGLVVYSKLSESVEVGVDGSGTVDLVVASKGNNSKIKLVSNTFNVFPYVAGSTTSCFQVVSAGGASACTGLQVTSNAAGSSCVLTATSSAADEALVLNPKGNGQITLEAEAGSVNVTSHNGNRVDICSNFGPINLQGTPVKIYDAPGVSGGYTGYMNLSITSPQIVSYTNTATSGSHTTVSKWLQIIVDGTTGYIPIYN